MRGVGEIEIALIILAIISVTIVASVFSKTTINSLSYNYLVYDFIAAHHLAYIQKNFGILQKDNIRNEEVVGMKNKEDIKVIVYDLKKKEVVYSDMENEEAEKKIIGMAKRVPEKTGDNLAYEFFWKKMRGMNEKINPELKFYGSYYAHPIIIEDENERDPGLLILVSYNLNLKRKMDKGKNVTLEAIEWVQNKLQKK